MEHAQGIENLKRWGKFEGIEDTSLYTLARLRLEQELSMHHFYKDVKIDGKTYRQNAKRRIEHPLPTIDKGFYDVDCATDVSAYSPSELANMIVKVSNRATDDFIQQIRRRISILERPLVTARKDGKSYIYANFNPEYAQYAITILRVYYNFCVATKVNGKRQTPAQRIGITDKHFDWKDIIYFR